MHSLEKLEISYQKRKQNRTKVENLIYTNYVFEEKIDITKLLNELCIIDYEADKFYQGDVLGLHVFLEPNNKKILSEIIEDFELYRDLYSNIFPGNKNEKVFYTAGLLDFFRLKFNKIVKLKNKTFYVK